MLERVGNGASEGHWLRAEQQGGGRGRLGRAWLSPTGNIYTSTMVSVLPTDPAASTLAFVAGLSVHDSACRYLDRNQALLKWPNDLMIDGAKMAGMLLERSADAVVVGIGLNANVRPQIEGRATACLADFAGAPIDLPFLMESLAGCFSRRLEQWRNEGLTATLADWLDRAHPPGTPLAVTQADGSVISGFFAGLRQDGALRLSFPDGRIIDVMAGDVELVRG